MNDTQVTKRKIGALIAKNLIVMLVAVIVALTGVLAWFSNTTSAEANGINVECKAPDGVEIAIAEHNTVVEPDKLEYGSNLKLVSGEGILANLDLQEVTSDGITFVRPALIQQNGVAIANTSEDWREATAGTEYICFDLYMRTKAQDIQVSLSSSSSFSPISSILSWGSSYSPTDNDNASTYGNFSRDALIGATRASVVGYNSEAKSYTDNRLLWIPRPDICLRPSASDFNLITGITEDQKDIYGTYYHYYYDNNKEHHKAVGETVIASTVSDSSVKLGENVVLTSFDVDEDGAVIIDGYRYVHVVYNTWIEGEDDEARLALANGRFNINLQLIANTVNK